MAEILPTHDFGQGGKHSKYPWKQYTDGQIWKLTQGVDYTCTTESFKQAAYSWSKRHDLKLRIHMDKQSSYQAVVLQAQPEQ